MVKSESVRIGYINSRKSVLDLFFVYSAASTVAEDSLIFLHDIVIFLESLDQIRLIYSFPVWTVAVSRLDY